MPFKLEKYDDIISGIKSRLKSDAGKKIAAVVAVILLVAIVASMV